VTSFWREKSLAEMSPEEWEQLCDGCGKCCLHKLEDEDTGELFFTRVTCRYLDENTCRCTDYPNRKTNVPECLVLSTQQPETFEWLPQTCAYRLLAEGEALPQWHPLLSGDANSVHTAEISVMGKVLSETLVHPDGLEEHIVHWV